MNNYGPNNIDKDEYKVIMGEPKSKYILIGDLPEYDDYCMGCHMAHHPGENFVAINGYEPCNVFDECKQHGDDPKEIAKIIIEKILYHERGKSWNFTIIHEGRFFELHQTFDKSAYRCHIPEIDIALDDALEKMGAKKKKEDAEQKALEKKKKKQQQLEEAKRELEYAQKQLKELEG